MTYRAVFFDAGGTLINPHPSFTELLSRTLLSEGHRVEPDQIVQRIPLIAALFTRASKTGELWSVSPERSRAFWDTVYRTLLEDLGIPYTPKLSDRFYAVFTDVRNYRLFPDALPVLQRLSAGGVFLGVISNFEQWLERLLSALEVSSFFEVRVISGAEGMEKPDPKIFLLALERAGLEPGESVYVGDSVEFDVLPAQAVGMRGILVDRSNRHPDFTGTRIASLAELPAALGLEAPS